MLPCLTHYHHMFSPISKDNIGIPWPRDQPITSYKVCVLFLHSTHQSITTPQDSLFNHCVEFENSKLLGGELQKVLNLPQQGVNLDTGQLSRPVPQNPAHCPSTPRTPKGTPNAPLNFRPCPAPTSANSNASPANSNASPANSNASPANSNASPANSNASPANSNASPANSDGPLANFGACPTATDTYPGPPEPREPPLLFPIFATHHQLNTLVPPTYFRVSRQPRGNPHSPMIPSMYQRGTILDHNRHPPPPSSSAKPRRHSRRTPKSSGISQSYLSLPVLSQSPGLVSSPFRYRSRYCFVSLFESTLVLYQPRPISSDAVLTPTLLYQVRTSLFARSQTSSVPNDLPSNPGSVPIDHTATYSLTSANLPYGLLPEPHQDRLVSSQSDFSGPSRICLDHTPPTTRTSHQGPERLQVFGYQCKGITPA
ncbi:hypothetical protein E4T56_gene13504 [Termitomyces sp. T112]|nr:hypothetical protein E4T56_gene13504 [Termitomyces sp. T112]